jgi:hypothetical protein
MKKLFTKRYAMAAMAAGAVIMALTATSCTKTDELSETKTKNAITSINANIDEGLTKVYIAPDGSTTNGKKVTWKTSDAITVINDATNASAVYTYDGTDNAQRGSFKNTSGSLNASAGNQVYAFYNANGTVDAAKNAISVSYTGATANDQAIWDGNTTSGDATNNSLMYAGASVASDNAVPLVTFKNANAIIKSTVTGGTSAQTFNYITVVSGNGMMPIAGTATISGTGDAVTLKWSDRTFGDAEYHSASTLNLSANNTWNQLIIPSMQFYNADGTVANVTAKIGPIYYLFSDAPLATATKVYYIKTDNPATLVAGKSYGLNKGVQEAAIITPNGTGGEVNITDKTKTVWINQANGSVNWYGVGAALKEATTPNNITLIQAIQTYATPDPFYGGNDKLYAYINNYCTTVAATCFFSCTSLTYVSLAKVTELPLQAFDVSNSIKEIFLPKVTSIGVNALRNCPSLTKLIFGSIITNWSTDALGDNLSQTGATVPGNIDLVLKKGQTGVSGNTFNGLTFKSITFMD